MCPMYSYVLCYNIEKSGFNAVSAHLLLKNLVVSWSSNHEFEMCYWCIFHKRFLLHPLKKRRDDPEITIFGLKISLVQSYGHES